MTPKKIKGITSSDNLLVKKVSDLENKAYLLKTITTIRKIAISNGAYSTKNMEAQDIKFENLNVPEWEKQIIRDSWEATKKLSHELLYELKGLNEMILNNVHSSIKEKTPKNLLKEMFKNHVDNL
jgi:hypothetical protein